jgi:hypothetical protein
MASELESDKRKKSVNDADEAFIDYIKVQIANLHDEELKEETKIKIESIVAEARLSSVRKKENKRRVRSETRLGVSDKQKFKTIGL